MSGNCSKEVKPDENVERQMMPNLSAESSVFRGKCHIVRTEEDLSELIHDEEMRKLLLAGPFGDYPLNSMKGGPSHPESTGYVTLEGNGRAGLDSFFNQRRKAIAMQLEDMERDLYDIEDAVEDVWTSWDAETTPAQILSGMELCMQEMRKYNDICSSLKELLADERCPPRLPDPKVFRLAGWQALACGFSLPAGKPWRNLQECDQYQDAFFDLANKKLQQMQDPNEHICLKEGEKDLNEQAEWMQQACLCWIARKQVPLLPEGLLQPGQKTKSSADTSEPRTKFFSQANIVEKVKVNAEMLEIKKVIETWTDRQFSSFEQAVKAAPPLLSAKACHKTKMFAVGQKARDARHNKFGKAGDNTTLMSIEVAQCTAKAVKSMHDDIANKEELAVINGKSIGSSVAAAKEACRNGRIGPQRFHDILQADEKKNLDYHGERGKGEDQGKDRRKGYGKEGPGKGQKQDKESKKKGQGMKEHGKEEQGKGHGQKGQGIGKGPGAGQERGSGPGPG